MMVGSVGDMMVLVLVSDIVCLKHLNKSTFRYNYPHTTPKDGIVIPPGFTTIEAVAIGAGVAAPAAILGIFSVKRRNKKPAATDSVWGGGVQFEYIWGEGVTMTTKPRINSVGVTIWGGGAKSTLLADSTRRDNNKTNKA